jgi:hypothetical protein
MARTPHVISWLALAVVTPACGGSDERVPAVDAGVAVDASDIPPDPFEGMFDEGSEFPRKQCRAGALAGFARDNVWVPLGLRTDAPGGALRTFVDDFLSEAQVPHTLTADDLIIRRSEFSRFAEEWRLTATDVCEVLADGTLRGSTVICSGERCFEPQPFSVAPTHRIAGEAEGMNLSLVGALALEGHPLNVRAAGDHAYLVMGERGLRIVSVANPAAPVLVGSYVPAQDNYFNDVKLIEAAGRRYAVLGGSPVEVIDVTAPSAPSLVATIATSSHTLFIDGTTVYVADGFSTTLTIVDITDPRAPVERSVLEVDAVPLNFGGFHDLHAAGGYVYLSTFLYGLVVVDARDPAAPVVAGMTEEDGTRYWHSPWLTQVANRPILLNGDEFAGPTSGVRLLDGDPASATYLDTIADWHLRDDISTHNVMARGATVYLTHYQDGVRVLDITNPAAPAQIGYFNTWSEDLATAAYFSGAIGLDVDPARRRIYVADLLRGFLVLEGTQAVFPP